MNNFVNLRLQTYNHYKEINTIKHNLRTINTKSKLNTNPCEFVEIYPHSTFKKAQEWRKEHNELHKARTQRNLRMEQSTTLDGVLSFSEALKHNMGHKFSQEEWKECCINTIQEVAKFLDSEILYVTFHFDETTPHCQYCFKNFDKEGYSIWGKNYTRDKLSQLQDIAAKNFEKLGIQRGQKKEITGVTHTNLNKFYALKEKELQDNLRQTTNQFKQLRQEIHLMSLNVEDLNFDKKKINDEISQLQEISRTKIKSLKEIDTKILIMAKLSTQEKLTQEEKDYVKSIAPTLFQFVENDKQKQALNTILTRKML